MSLWLTDDELFELTGYRQRDKQKRALAELKTQFRLRPADGFPLVERAQFEIGLTSGRKRKEPDYSAVSKSN